MCRLHHWLVKKEAMSPEEVEMDMKAQVAAMVQATLEKMQSDGVITINAKDSDKVWRACNLSMLFLCFYFPFQKPAPW